MSEIQIKKLEQENAQLKALMASAADVLAGVSSGLRFTAKRLTKVTASCTAYAEKVEVVATTLQSAAISSVIPDEKGGSPCCGQ